MVAINVNWPAKPLAERLFILGSRGPGFLLRFAIIVAGQLLDAGNENRRQHGRIRRQHRPQRGFGQGLSHLVYHMPKSFKASATAPASSDFSTI